MKAKEAVSAIKKYQQTGSRAGGEYSNPHRLIQLLMEGALEKIAMAKGFMERKEIANKGSYLSWAISIVDGLRVSLDHENGGELAGNLEALYDYMQRRMIEANIKNDTAILDEVSGLLRQIKDAWDQIPSKFDVENFKQGSTAKDV